MIVKKKKWETSDLKALRVHSRKRTPIKRVSKELKRTIGALRWKACQLGIGLGEDRRI
jgi:hypothetical protein